MGEDKLLQRAVARILTASHDIPKNFAGFPFDAFAQHATVNAPLVYYGGSASVESRLERAINANSHLDISFVPVGAGWIGDAGGCSSAAACAERAVAFLPCGRGQRGNRLCLSAPSSSTLLLGAAADIGATARSGRIALHHARARSRSALNFRLLSQKCLMLTAGVHGSRGPRPRNGCFGFSANFQ